MSILLSQLGIPNLVLERASSLTKHPQVTMQTIFFLRHVVLDSVSRTPAGKWLYGDEA